MSRVVILHGMPDEDEYFATVGPSSSNRHWIPWLQKQLVAEGHVVQTPEIFNSFRPDYSVWQTEFERHLVPEPMILVGHSCGAGFLVRWLSEHPDVNAEKVVLVAPWLDPDRVDTIDFFEFEIDGNLADRVGELHLFGSQDDMESVRKSVDILLEAVPGMIVHDYPQMGHFCFADLKTDEFPDLFAAVSTAGPAPT